CANMAYYFDYW
nr:immunoglobulin heavy chain junction region [Mus musculus]